MLFRSFYFSLINSFALVKKEKEKETNLKTEGKINNKHLSFFGKHNKHLIENKCVCNIAEL